MDGTHWTVPFKLMVCVKSQDVKLKRMKYHDPFLWGNVLKGLYSLLMMSPVFYIQNRLLFRDVSLGCLLYV